MKNLTLLLALLSLSAPALTGQEAKQPQLPRVFELGTHEAAHMMVDSLIHKTLFGICGADFEQTRERWVDLLEEMEEHARQIDYPLDGLKLFLHVYCDPQGNILHLGFLAAPDSRHAPFLELRAFFSTFMRNRAFPLPEQAPHAFKYNSKVSFPLYPELATSEDD